MPNTRDAICLDCGSKHYSGHEENMFCPVCGSINVKNGCENIELIDNLEVVE